MNCSQFERFTRKIDSAGPCWNWTGSLDGDGYGLFYKDRRITRAHRAAYEFYVGPIPAGLHLDHLCRNPRCVRPDHLEAVTNKENILRGFGAPARNAAKTHCSYGHPFDASNTQIRPGHGRVCIACKSRVNAAKLARARSSQGATT